MFDHHVDELDLLCRRGPACQKLTERLAHRRAVEPHNRTHKATETSAGLAGAFDISGLADTGVEQHLFEFAQVSRCQRLTSPQLVEDNVILVCLQEMPGLEFEPREVGLAELR